MSAHTLRCAMSAAALVSAAAAFAQPVLITAPTTINPGDASIMGIPLASAQITVRGTTLTVNGRFTIASLALERSGANPATLTHDPNFTHNYSGTIVSGAHLIITGNCSIQGSSGGVASSINLVGLGFPGATGPGAGTTSDNGGIGGAGGAHGGNGTAANYFPGGIAYDSIAAPTAFGSGGGFYLNGGYPAGAGGGCIRLDVNGTCTIDGLIDVSGTSAYGASGAGAGGSIFITASTLAGSGTLVADGSNGGGNAWGAGGGGRIALRYATNSFSGTMSATAGYAGNNYPYRAGAGTIYLQRNTDAPALRIINTGANLGAPTPIPANLNAGSILISSSANAVFATGQTISGNLSLASAARAELTGTTTIGGSLLLADPNTTLTHAATAPITLNITGNCSIAQGSSINLNGVGYGPATGPGAGTTSDNGGIGGAGASHGGNGSSSGGFLGGIAYDSIDNPSDMGSGGGHYLNSSYPGGAGGGALRATIGGTLTVDGSISADGTAGYASSGGGAGGSIRISADAFTGSGTISANGSNGGGNAWGAGGGGRIALYSTSDSFAGSVSAIGGFSGNSYPNVAGAGTIYQKLAANPRPTLKIVGAGGTLAAPTPITANLSPLIFTVASSANAICSVPQTFSGNVNVTSAARLELMGSNSIAGSLLLSGTDSTLTHQPALPLTLSVAFNASIGAGSAINLDGIGFPATQGPGAGTTSSNGTVGGAGAGHGGTGSSTSEFPGGNAYDSISQPTQLGSGGGNYLNSSVPGGAGGGALHLIVSRTLSVDGVITATGAQGGSSSGSGSGGSLWIESGTLTGAGTIAANGANGGGNSWGPGGGGRVALYYDTSTFTGQLNTFGAYGAGSSPNRSGAGTVYTKRAASPFPSLTIDGNNTDLGAFTPINVNLSSANTTITRGARAAFNTPQTFTGPVSISSNSRCELVDDNSIDGNLTISASSVLAPSPQTPISITISGNTDIDPSSAISGDGLGYPSATGPGAGTSSDNGGIGAAGGGYGGTGGDAGPFPGGQPYGSLTQPLDMGSGGGFYVNQTLSGGAGGGSIRLDIAQTLAVNGALTARGVTAYGASGGGSGGSLNIKAGQLAGSGIVSANGANGGGNYWGPGGGGRIAIYSCDVIMPPSSITANAGIGGALAGDGTIYFGSSGITITQQPQGGALNSGSYTQINVIASGAGPLTYQWRKRSSDGDFINLTEGQDGIYYNTTDNTLFVLGIDCSGGGDYDCLVCDTCGCFPSAIATIEVNATGDFNHDGGIDGADVDAFFTDWSAGSATADVNDDGGVDGADVEFFFDRWARGC